ncbi:mammalian cell entry protein [Aliidiomarina sedimenti]|uniref:Mammalian cell entry protein n=1 Tax=Aliidiomarina sedimenti TaxID=1933879 RepID=A0ABY0C060_9GAMM|nr:intermembrane transport protein PqiB [Aliidiomarina sedimenti]RUO30765.1 mammalian cell entry protein [Aliidiomarina sedimenti]
MNDTFEKASRRKARRISSIWLVPAVALAIGVWMAFDTVSGRGPLVTLELRNAEGIEAGQTLVKVKDVAVGRVEGVRLSDDFSHAISDIRMFDGTEAMLTEQTRFWLVKPRIGREGISGLGTILSGAYIEMQPAEGASGKRDFVALAQPPVLRGDENGLTVQLRGQYGNQLNPGDPVTFRGHTVGRIETTEFDIEEQLNVFSVFIEEPFMALITDDVRFWQNSGVSMQFGADGVNIDIGSLESVLAGGITFDTLVDTRYGEPAEDGAEFTLFRDQEAARQEGFTHYADYLLLVEDSVRGLSPGAPVEYRGIRVGTVLQVPYTGGENLGQNLLERQVPVLIRMEPERLGPRFAGFNMDLWEEQLEGLFERGLSASLRAGNLLTGALYVDIGFSEDGTIPVTEANADYPVFPVQSGSGGSLDKQLGELISNLNQIDFGQLGSNAEQTLATSEETLRAVSSLSQQVTRLLSDPAMEDMPARLNATLAELERMMAGYSSDAPAYNDLSRSLDSLQQILNDLEPFAEQLRERPNSLLFNPPTERDPEPRRPRQ